MGGMGKIGANVGDRDKGANVTMGVNAVDGVAIELLPIHQCHAIGFYSISLTMAFALRV